MTFAFSAFPLGLRRPALLPALMVCMLAACGGGGGSVSGQGAAKLPPAPTDGVARFASGPILNACTRQPRTAATRERCGCVQAAANLTLTSDEQQRGARYFENPELLQEMKLSDTARDERFWYTWDRFVATAEELCRAI